MHSAISQFSNKCCSILDIVLDLEQMAEGQQFKSKMATVDVMLQSAIAQLNLPPGFERIQQEIGAYCLDDYECTNWSDITVSMC